VNVKVLYDKNATSARLHAGWGFSALVDSKILFDTGDNGGWLLENMKALKADIHKLKGVVISHDHWDHTGGLWELLKRRTGLPVYACPHFSSRFKEKVRRMKGRLVETQNSGMVAKRIFVTGEIEGEYKNVFMPEQALVLKTKNVLTVITGCAHPGIIKMLEHVRKMSGLPIYAVFGGFHLQNKKKRHINNTAAQFLRMKVKKAGPTHCSGNVSEQIFMDKFKNDFLSIKAGTILRV